MIRIILTQFIDHVLIQHTVEKLRSGIFVCRKRSVCSSCTACRLEGYDLSSPLFLKEFIKAALGRFLIIILKLAVAGLVIECIIAFRIILNICFFRFNKKTVIDQILLHEMISADIKVSILYRKGIRGSAGCYSGKIYWGSVLIYEYV